MRIQFIFNRTGKLNKNGLALIQLRAYQGGKNKYFSTKIYLLPRQWKNNKVVDHPNAYELNLKLRNLQREIESFVIRKQLINDQVTFKCIERFIKYDDHSNFLEFWEKEMSGDNSLRSSTKKQHKVTLGYLQDYQKNISFSELKYEFIHGFNNYLLGKGLGQNTIYNHHKRIKRYINLAIKKDLIEARNNPYKHFKSKTTKSKREVLSLVEVERLEALKFPENKMHLQIIKDMFLFGCYTGLRFSDIAALKRENIHVRNDVCMLKIIAQKTNKLLDLPLNLLHNGKPAKLIRKYLEQNYKKKVLFPGITNQYANRALKEIAAYLGTDKKMTTHVARHTFATQLAMKVKPALLQKILQHSKIETTMIYVHLSEEMLLEELRKVNW